MALSECQLLVPQVLHHQVHHKLRNPLISHGYHLEHKGGLLCHPLRIDHRLIRHPCSKGHIFPSNIIPYQQFHNNSMYHLHRCHKLYRPISSRSISDNNFHNQGHHNLYPINNKFREPRVLQIKSLLLLQWYNQAQSSWWTKIKQLLQKVTSLVAGFLAKEAFMI